MHQARECEREEEQHDRNQRHGGGSGSSKVVTQCQAQPYGEESDDDGVQHHPRNGASDQARCRRWTDQKTENEKRTDGLKTSDDRNGDEDQQGSVRSLRLHAPQFRLLCIET